MKKSLFLTLLLLTSTIGLNAQITEGHVKYKVEVSSDEPDMALAVSMMSDATLDIYFQKDKSRTEMDMGVMNTTVIVNAAAENSIMLMDMMGSKFAVLMEKEELDQENDSPKPVIQLINETKTILGYKCKKAVITISEGIDAVYWYTEELKVNTFGQKSFNESVPGFPLEFSQFQGGLDMKLTATVIEKTVDSKKFDITVPEGYTLKTMEELGGMGQ